MRRLLFVVFLLAVSLAARAQQQVLISEVMYNPADGKPEFIELWNVSNTPLDIEKWKFTEGVEFQFPLYNAAATQAHLLQPRERIIVSGADAAATRAAYPAIPGAIRVFGPWSASKSLANGGDTIVLKDRNNVIIAQLSYEDSGHWPVAADGTGHSLVLANDNRAIDDWRQWRQSVNNGGSPGLAEPAVPAVGLTISEFHVSPVTGRVDWVELRNDGRTSASANALFLSGLSTLVGKVALSGGIAAGAYASFDVDFPADNNGDIRIYLTDATNNVKSAVRQRRIVGRDSWQLFPAASGQWYSSPTATRDAANDPPRTTSIVINEIMADPPSNQRDGEFIELYNRGAATVNLGGWKLDEAVNFTFPPNTFIAPGAYLVVAANRSHLNSSYPGLAAVGDWSGSLGNNGELIRLLDLDGNLATEVDYRFGGEWPELASGNGSSLELVNPSADNRFGGAWRDSEESQKSTFQAFTINGGTYLKGVGNGSPSPNDDEIRIWGVSDTHVVLRNIVLRPTAGGNNILVNPGVTTLNNNNVDGWQSRGTHATTFHDAEGVHLVATSHGDNKCNHMEKDTAGMLASTQYTLTFEARWIFGKPRLVAQSWDSSWGGTVRVPIPVSLGTPGAQNSRSAANPPPQVTSLLHSPPIPTSSQTVTVTARVVANTPLSTVQVIHRKDNISANGAWNTTAMNDGGTGGDAIAGDGIWTAQIVPGTFGYSSGGNYIAEFYIRATAASGALEEFPRGGAVQPGLWATDSQAVTTDLRRMRIVISQYWLDSLNQSSGTGGHTIKYNYKYPRLSNRYVPCTFISNESDIYYGSTVRKTGSPWTRQTDALLTRGRVVLPGDRLFRGKSKLYWDNDAGNSMLHNRVTRYWLYLLGVPGNQNEVCRVTRNADTYAVRETSEAFDKEMLDRIWENGSDGQFIELDDKFWISDDGSAKPGNQDGTWGYKGLDARGYDNPTWYHSQDIPKSRESEYDYSGFIEWTKQLGNATISQEQCERLADTQAMTALAAVRGYIGDWDNLTINRGKNGYMYQRATDHKWMLLHWDSDLAFQNTSEAVLGNLAGVNTYFGRPFIRHYMNYYLSELLTTYPANGARLQAWLTAEENASTAYSSNGAFYSTWSTGRVGQIQNFLGASRTVAFAVSSPANNSTTAASTINVVGTAPSTAFSVSCVDHPEAVLTWGGVTAIDPAAWTLSGVRMKTGANVLTFRMFNISGVQVGGDITRTINKTGNAAPAMLMTADPSSYNVRLGEILTLDATGSTDPDGSALTFVWTVTPSTGVNVSYPVPGKATAQFTSPGIYTFSVQGTNATSTSATLVREVAVFSAEDFDSFGNATLSQNLSASGTELLDNYSLNSWYSLTTSQGSLNLQITDVAALLLNNPPTFPLITRPLSATDDFALQTDFTFETRFTGSFYTGLFLETMSGGQSIKYAFGVDGGTNLIARRATGAAAYQTVTAVAFPGANASGVGATLRIRRVGSQLQFQRRVNEVWTQVSTVTMAAGTTVVQGGLFATTSAPQHVRVAFDYLGVVDPGQSTNLFNSLRISEIMYNPPGVGGIEFIELTNIGSAPIDLAGVYFEDGKPFDQFTFTSLVLAPGAYCVVTNVTAEEFQARYGTGVIIAGQYTGALSNGGEQIVLKDAAGNPILDFSYGDLAPWPVAADGGGSSLEIINPANPSSFYDGGSNWLASAEAGGSPGYLGFALDSDNDGQPDAFERVFGSDPYNAGLFGGLAPPTRAPNGDIILTWTSVPGHAYVVEASDDLAVGSWQILATVNATDVTSTYTDATANAAARCYRIRASVP